MKLTLKKLIWATVISLILIAVKLTLDQQYGNWFSLSDVRFWADNIAVVIAWVMYFIRKKRR